VKLVLAALPPDVRKGFAFPVKRLFLMPRLCLESEAQTQFECPASGKPQAFPTLDGKAAGYGTARGSERVNQPA